MAYNRNHARRLLDTSELELFEQSLDDRIGELSRSDLAKKVSRSRRLRDKYRDLFQRQSLATRERTGTKRGRSGVANERTAQKAAMIAEVLARFERQLDKVERAESRESRRAAVQRARKARGGGSRTTAKEVSAPQPRKAARGSARAEGPKEFTSEQAEAARNRAKISSPRNKAISAHVGSRGRRSQARRDSR